MIHEEKKALRRLIRQRKATVTEAQRTLWAQQLWQRLEANAHFIQAQTILCYYSLPDEVGTHAFVERWKDAKRILLPVVKGEELELRVYTGKKGMVVSEPFGIEEPAGEAFTRYEAIDLTLVPGMSFDAAGNRLGRGKGYYDRLLPRLSSYNIGICYGFQVSEHVPCEPFDRRMDAVLTEEGLLSEK